jgi:ribose 5-phosphate isomerase B
MAPDSASAGRLRIALGSDHEGEALKDKLIGHLREERHSVKDCGLHNADAAGAAEVVSLVAQLIAAGEVDLGIVASSSGAVASMAANKIPGIRCCHCQDTFSARQARRTAAADMLCLGARVLGDDLAAEIADAFVGEVPSDDQRHEPLRREIQALEDSFEASKAATMVVQVSESDG